MTTAMRIILWVVSISQALAAVAFFMQIPAVTGLWPYPGTTPLTNIFIASIFAAGAASTIWCLLTRHDAAFAGIGIDYVTLLAPLGVYSIYLGLTTGNAGLTGYGLFCLVGTLFGLGITVWSLRIPLDRSLPAPAPVRWSFLVFIIALLVVCTLLFLRTPNIIPWNITPDLSIVIGLMFLGATAYFVYGLLRPSWANAGGQLAGFLAYDVVLLWPFISRLGSVAPEHQLGQTIYLGVVIYSGLLAVYYLFLHRPTRAFGRAPASA